MRPSRRAFLALAGAAGAGVGAGGIGFLPREAAAAREGGRPLPLMSTYVAGSDRYAAPTLVGRLAKGVELKLRREPENGYDTRAVSVWTADEQEKLGYVPRIHNQALANLMDAGVLAGAQVSEVKGPDARPDISLTVTVVIPG